MNEYTKNTLCDFYSTPTGKIVGVYNYTPELRFSFYLECVFSDHHYRITEIPKSWRLLVNCSFQNFTTKYPEHLM